MEPADGLKQEIETLRNRLSVLSEAGVRITEDLDLDTVLQEVVNGVRSLTGARISGLTILDEAGDLMSFITSGMTAEEHQRFVDLPGGPEFFAYLSSLPELLRVSDFSVHTTALGLPEIGPPLGPVKGFLGAPIRHRGRHIGNLYLSDKEGGLEFTQEDEDTLLMFASQAAMAITNARRHREEQRVRADLETLVNTPPFVAGLRPTGRGEAPSYPASLNLRVKILDFIKSGGPILTVDRTIFEMWLGAL